MARHEDRYISFDLPRNWEDRSVVAYAAPTEPNRSANANLVVTRDQLEGDQQLSTYVDEQIAKLKHRLSGFVMRKRHDHAIDDFPASIVEFGSSGSAGPLEQQLIVVQLPERVALSMTLTAPRPDADQLKPLFDRIASSLRVNAKAVAK